MTSATYRISSTMLKALKEMRMDDEMADIVLVCDGGEIKAHRHILSYRSDYFKKMLRNNFTESQTNRVQLANINQDVMNSILDYIYFESTEKINKENLKHVLQVHQSSHLFQLNDLTNHCWNLIMKSLDIESVVDIWNAVLLYGEEEEEIFVILHFVLENLEKIIEKDKFFALDFPQFKRLMEEIQKNNISVTDSILVGIIEWCKSNPLVQFDLEKFLLHLNYDFVSNDCMGQLMKEETSIFTESFYKKMFLSRILSPEKRQPIKANLNAKTLSIKYNLSVKYFLFEGYVKRVNGYLLNGSTSVKIVDLFNEANGKTITQLPFLISDGVFIPIQVGHHLYIIGGVPGSSPESTPNTSFILYDWQKNTIAVKPTIPTFIEKQVYTAVVGDNIYVVEGYKDYAKLLSYSISQEKWETIPCNLTHYVISCVVLKETLYFVCMSSYGKYHYLYQLNNEKVDLVGKIPIPCYDGSFTESPYQGASYVNTYKVKKKVVVHNNKLFIFMFSDKSDLNSCVFWDPQNSQWNLNKIDYNCHLSGDSECFSVPGDYMIFYVHGSNKIFAVHEDSDGKVEEIMGDRQSVYDGKLSSLQFRRFQSVRLFNTDV